ncbi:MAG: AAA family ATPase, partial [Candidatus Methanomethylophilaceae archaeon]
MKNIPIGVDDFKELRDGGGYYVDKSLFIADILDSGLTKVFLYTRPRRFGKSLNLSMLDAYLNMEYKGNTWFDGLAISEKRPDDITKNGFPVI